MAVEAFDEAGLASVDLPQLFHALLVGRGLAFASADLAQVLQEDDSHVVAGRCPRLDQLVDLAQCLLLSGGEFGQVLLARCRGGAFAFGGLLLALLPCPASPLVAARRGQREQLVYGSAAAALRIDRGRSLPKPRAQLSLHPLAVALGDTQKQSVFLCLRDRRQPFGQLCA